MPSSSLESKFSTHTPVVGPQNFEEKRMNPHPQFECGPLLRYDTMERGVWHGAALIVTDNAQRPTLKYSWDPGQLLLPHSKAFKHEDKVDLGPHPADPTAQPYQGQTENEHSLGPNAEERTAPGQRIYNHAGGDRTYTFWRFLIQIQLADHEMGVQYSINNGMKMGFVVPGSGQTMRLAAYSCNGFRADVRLDTNFCGPKFQSAHDPLWFDLLVKHHEQPFHVLVGGGDQLYCDGIASEPELQNWIDLKPEEKKRHPITPEISSAIDRFYFSHYCKMFRSGAFARANSSIPMLNMLDDHDMVGGFGSYPEDLQRTKVFNRIGSRGYFFFLLFQCFINESLVQPVKSLIIGGPGTYVPFPSHSFLSPIGPTVWMLMLDCRAERKLGQVCGEDEYRNVFKRLYELPGGVEHLIIQLGVPIAYPRMVLLESILSSIFKPLVMLLGPGSLGLKESVNKFNANAELLDDLIDRWTSKYHKKERNNFIRELQQLAQNRRIRISFLTGDVHCAAVGVFKTLQKCKRHPAPLPESDHRYMLNIVTSAIVNTPPPIGALTLVNKLSRRRHPTMHRHETDEEMYPLFIEDTDGSKPKNPYFMGRRNWCSVSFEHLSQELLFDIRVEKEPGFGETKAYSIRAPPPRWTR